jgi:hypothetical protein
MFNGIVILAPLSLPITVSVVVKVDKLVPNKVLIVVPVIVNEVPIWLDDNTAPEVVFKSVIPGVVTVIPVPANEDNNLESETVTIYPFASNVLVAPK